MTKETKLEQQLPGHGFSSGSITLYEIAESQGRKLGSQRIEENAIVSDRDKEILANAIPARLIERAISKSKKDIIKTVQYVRGAKFNHTSSGKMVTIIKPNVDTSVSGSIRHLVIVSGTGKKVKVKEENLKEL